MEGWKDSLPKADNEVLIKAVIQAISNYVMSIVKMPKSFCDKLTTKVMRFWWSNSGLKRGNHWKKKQLWCSSKDSGGLGFKDFNAMNSALLSKQAWRIIQDPTSYWAATLKGIYFPNTTFWNADDKRRSSWVWKSLLHGRELLKQVGSTNWRPPRANCKKVNSNAAYNKDTGKGIIGVICRDDRARVLTMIAS